MNCPRRTRINTDSPSSKQHEELPERIIGCAHTISNGLGVGFLESVYEKALVHECRKAGLKAEQHFPLQVKYDDLIVGEYYAEIPVNSEVILELKAVRAFEGIHMAQSLNYLHVTNLKVALLVNFGTPIYPCSSVANNS